MEGASSRVVPRGARRSCPSWREGDRPRFLNHMTKGFSCCWEDETTVPGKKNEPSARTCNATAREVRWTRRISRVALPWLPCRRDAGSPLGPYSFGFAGRGDHADDARCRGRTGGRPSGRIRVGILALVGQRGWVGETQEEGTGSGLLDGDGEAAAGMLCVGPDSEAGSSARCRSSPGRGITTAWPKCRSRTGRPRRVRRCGRPQAGQEGASSARQHRPNYALRG